jgi:transposase
VSRRGRGSKQGNAHLKSAYTQAATYAVRCYAKIRGCYERHLRRHSGFGGKLIAKNIIAHKLALVCYHILREGASYEEKRMFGN